MIFMQRKREGHINLCAHILVQGGESVRGEGTAKQCAS